MTAVTRGGLSFLAIALLATALRVWGLSYGLPHPRTRPDEEYIVGNSTDIALGLVKAPKVFPYPHLVYYVDALALLSWRKVGVAIGAYGRSDDFAATLEARQPALQYLICRSMSALFGVATVLAAGGAAFFAYRSKWVAMLSSLLVAVNFLHVRDSHFATVDVPMTLFVTLCLMFALRFVGSRSRRDFLLAAACAGLAASAKYNGGLVIVCPLAALIPDLFRSRPWRSAATLAFGAATMFTAFVFTSPYCVVHWRDLVAGLARHQHILFSGRGSPAWRDHLTATLPTAFGWPAWATAVLGVVRAAWKRRRSDRVLLALILPGFASIAGMTVAFPRYALPLVPPLAVLAAEAALAVIPTARVAVIGVTVLILTLPPLTSSVAYDRLATIADTRLLVEEWMKRNVPPGSHVAVCEGYGAPTINEDERRPPAYRREVVRCTPAALLDTGASFVITYDHPQAGRFDGQQAALTWLRAKATPLVVFDPFRKGTAVNARFSERDAFYLPYSGFEAMERGGPIITIWRFDR